MKRQEQGSSSNTNHSSSSSSSSSSSPVTGGGSMIGRGVKSTVASSIKNVNLKCGDCGKGNPSTLSTVYGVLLCDLCASIHFGHLNSNVLNIENETEVKSILSPSYLQEILEKGGNQKLNDITGSVIINENATISEREKKIVQKYTKASVIGKIPIFHSPIDRESTTVLVGFCQIKKSQSSFEDHNHSQQEAKESESKGSEEDKGTSPRYTIMSPSSSGTGSGSGLNNSSSKTPTHYFILNPQKLYFYSLPLVQHVKSPEVIWIVEIENAIEKNNELLEIKVKDEELPMQVKSSTAPEHQKLFKYLKECLLRYNEMNGKSLIRKKNEGKLWRVSLLTQSCNSLNLNMNAQQQSWIAPEVKAGYHSRRERGFLTVRGQSSERLTNNEKKSIPSAWLAEVEKNKKASPKHERIGGGRNTKQTTVTPIKQGTLKKRDQEAKMNKGTSKNKWNSRYFVLKSSSLDYYNTLQDYQSVKPPLGLMPLTNLVVNISDRFLSDKHIHSLCLELISTKSSFWVVAESEAEMKSWIESIYMAQKAMTDVHPDSSKHSSDATNGNKENRLGSSPTMDSGTTNDNSNNPKTGPSSSSTISSPSTIIPPPPQLQIKEKEGWLERLTLGGVQGWKKQWIRMETDGTLRIYKNQADIKLGVEPLEAHHLITCSVVPVVASVKEKKPKKNQTLVPEKKSSKKLDTSDNQVKSLREQPNSATHRGTSFAGYGTSKKQHKSFKLNTPTQEIMFKASDDNEKQEWMKVLSDTIQALISQGGAFDLLPDVKLKDSASLPKDIQSEILSFQLEDFAINYFRSHRRRTETEQQVRSGRGGDLQSGRFLRSDTLCERTKQLLFSKIHPTEPLLRYTSKDKEREALQCCVVIFKYMECDNIASDNPSNYQIKKAIYLGENEHLNNNNLHSESKKKLTVAKDLIALGFKRAELRDEIYSYICKQCTGNPSLTSELLGYQLLSFVSESFSPTKNLEQYLLKYLTEIINDIALYKNFEVKSIVLFTLRKLSASSHERKTERILSIEELSDLRTAPFRKPLFNVSLDLIMQNQKSDTELPPDVRNSAVPFTLVRFTTHLKAMGLAQTLGVFRVSADSGKIAYSKIKIELNDWSWVERNDGSKGGKISAERVHEMACLMKLWIKSLDPALIEGELYHKSIEKGEEGSESVTKFVDERIKTNSDEQNKWEFIKYIIRFLRELSEAHELTKMSKSNLALIFSPLILRCPWDDPMKILSNTHKETAFLLCLIEDWKID